MKDLKVDFGAVGDDSTDDTAAVQAALEWVASAHDRLDIPPGFYKVTAPLSLVQKSNFYVSGRCKQSGTYNTAFRWHGPAGGTMLLLDGVRDSEWTDLSFDSRQASGEPSVVVDIDKIAPGGGISRKNSFRRSLLRGGAVATVRISNTATTNNEANLFEDVTCSSMAGSMWQNGAPGGPIGYWVKHINAKNTQIVRGEISGKEAAVFVDQGSAHLFGVEISGCNVWMRKNAGGEPCMIERCDGDSSKTFLELLASQTGPIVATGNRFAQGYDGPFFIWGDTIGPALLSGNEFASGGYRPNATYVMPGSGPNLIAIGNTFPNDTLLPVPGVNVPKFRSLYALGNMYYGPGGTRNLMNDYLVPFRTGGASASSLQIGGTAGFRGEFQVITQANTPINSNQAVAPINPTVAMVLNGLPTIRPGIFEGQEIKVINVGSVSVGLIDQITLPGTGLALTSPTLSLPPKASANLVWTFALGGGRWLQTSPVVTPL